ncbi:MAG: hypothetical protein N3A72_11630 [bacterium]|nr:hypothetical protein [bacterium]
MVKRVFIFILLFYAHTPTNAVNINGIIDIHPVGYIVDRATPFAIHFSCWTSTFAGYTMVTAKIQILSDATTVINYTWSTAQGISAWRADEVQPSLCNPMSVSNTTVSGWLFGMSRSLTYFGVTTCKIRLYRGGSSFPHDISTSVLLYAWNTTVDAGWLEGIDPLIGAKTIVLAKDSSGKILGSYITEDNQIIEPLPYPSTAGYFRLSVPVGIVASLEFRNLNNQVIKTQNGPWYVTAGTITHIGFPTHIENTLWEIFENN